MELPRGASGAARQRVAHRGETGAGGGTACAAGCAAASPAREQDLALYEDAALQLLYQRCYPKFYEAGFGSEQANPARWRFYNEFLADWRHCFAIDGVTLPNERDPRHTFAWFRQIQRAFEITFRDIIGSSLPAARLRGAVWQSIFTHDMRRYRRTLYARMGEFATLITGPSGTGKELVARAIAESRYVPFDDRRLAFADDGETVFLPINISALSPTLVESELFGHKRGAFTGAVADRRGFLETCPELGSVFLDELGDMDPAIQVKLLRVIETRTFHPVGDTAARQFRGKLIAATNRDLAQAMRKGQFREDLYYRLCSDQVARRRWRSSWRRRRAYCANWCSTWRGAWRGRKATRWRAKCCRGSRRIWGRSTRGRGTIASWSSA